MSSISALPPANTPAAAAAPTATPKAQATAGNGAVPTDVKKVAVGAAKTSAAATLARAALKEATETSVQTQKEALGGDHQAQRLLQRRAATSINVKA